MSETSYRNRRGHKMSIGDAIDDIAKQDSPSKAGDKKPRVSSKSNEEVRKIKRRLRFRFPRLKRLHWLILLFMIALALSYGLMMTDGAKRDYERQAAQMRRQVTEISKSTSSTREPGSEVAKQLNSRLDANSDCSVEILSGAHWYGPAQQAKKHCQQVASSYTQLKKNLGNMETESIYAEQVKQILRDPLKNPTEGDFASIGDYEGRWHKATEELSGLAVADSFKAIHDKIISQVNAIAKQWKSLVQAHSDENKADFTSAEKNLTEGYVKLRSLDQEIMKPINERQAIVDELVDGLIIEE